MLGLVLLFFVTALLIYGAVYNHKRSKEKKFLELCRTGTAQEIFDALTSSHADIHAKDNQGRSALMYASHSNTPEVITLLANFGLNLNESIYGVTPLMLASQYNTAGAVKALLKSGASAKPSNPSGSEALRLAIMYNSSEAVDALLDAGASLTSEEKTALDELFKEIMPLAFGKDYKPVTTIELARLRFAGTETLSRLEAL